MLGTREAAAFEIKRKRLLAAPNLAGLPVVKTRGSVGLRSYVVRIMWLR